MAGRVSSCVDASFSVVVLHVSEKGMEPASPAGTNRTPGTTVAPFLLDTQGIHV